MKTQDIVFKFFDEKGGIPGNGLQEKLRCHYLDIKIIDSMGIIEMISLFEDKFKIRFEAEHLQSNEFQTIGGLIELVDRLRASS